MKPINLNELHAWRLSARFRVLAITAGFVMTIFFDLLIRPFRRSKTKFKSEE